MTPESALADLGRGEPASLTFLGTRANIALRNQRHRRHSVLRIAVAGVVVLIDCGEDWLPQLPRLRPTAIVLTHGHTDHVGGLARGASCPVYAPQQVWERLTMRDLDRQVIHPRESLPIGALSFEAFPVAHSVRAPAVGYRIATPQASFFYVPDVVQIQDERQALSGIELYIGDGSTLTRPILRYEEGSPVGHTSIEQQIVWCARNEVPRAIFTHCGSQILRGDERHLGAELRRMGRQRGVSARFAHDGMTMEMGSD